MQYTPQTLEMIHEEVWADKCGKNTQRNAEIEHYYEHGYHFIYAFVSRGESDLPNTINNTDMYK